MAAGEPCRGILQQAGIFSVDNHGSTRHGLMSCRATVTSEPWAPMVTPLGPAPPGATHLSRVEEETRWKKTALDGVVSVQLH